MTPERYSELVHQPDTDLTAVERRQGFHWCEMRDGELIGPGFHEMPTGRCLCGAVALDCRPVRENEYDRARAHWG